MILETLKQNFHVIIVQQFIWFICYSLSVAFPVHLGCIWKHWHPALMWQLLAKPLPMQNYLTFKRYVHVIIFWSTMHNFGDFWYAFKCKILVFIASFRISDKRFDILCLISDISVRYHRLSNVRKNIRHEIVKWSI